MTGTYNDALVWAYFNQKREALLLWHQHLWLRSPPVVASERFFRLLMTDTPTSLSILQRPYDSEINARIEWVWDGGVAWRLGDKHNGRKASGNAAAVTLAVVELAKAAVVRYQQSVCGVVASAPSQLRDLRGRSLFPKGL